MLRLTMLFCVMSLMLALPVSAELLRSGNFVVECDGNTGVREGAVNSARECNALINPGFENGELDPWTTNAWYVTDEDAYTGNYCATGVGNYWIMQEFAPIDVNLVANISFYSRQPEMAIQAVDLYYGPNDYDEFIVWPGASWTFHDVTSEMRPAGGLQAIRIWGYSGGGPDEDRTYVDDVMIEADLVTPIAEDSWSRIKQLF